MRILPSQSRRHEAESRVHVLVLRRQPQAVALGDARPVGDAGAAQRIGARDSSRRRESPPYRSPHPDRSRTPRCNRAGAWSTRQRLALGHAAHLAQTAGEQSRWRDPDPLRGAGVGRAAVGRIVFESAILRRIVRRRDHDAVGQAGRPPAVVRQDRMRERRRRRVAVLADRSSYLDAVRRQHFQRAGERRLGKRMRVLGQEQRPVDAFCRCGTRKSPA